MFPQFRILFSTSKSPSWPRQAASYTAGSQCTQGPSENWCQPRGSCCEVTSATRACPEPCALQQDRLRIAVANGCRWSRNPTADLHNASVAQHPYTTCVEWLHSHWAALCRYACAGGPAKVLYGQEPFLFAITHEAVDDLAVALTSGQLSERPSFW